MYPQVFSKTVLINASQAKLWAALTDPRLMQQWMHEEDIMISTSWQPYAAISIHGNMHGLHFENNGIVLQFEPERTLSYSHLSSISDLPDEPASYTVLKFVLIPEEQGMILAFTATNFPTESIYRHIAFYWNVTLEVLKRFVEGGQ